ncbi:MAG TPA: TlpA disulfide reductase family protein [Gemmatimonadaceae bacterium]|jgi:thiol-disulfide isomerase/thioredoxin|nr:TlpA disulfide reductase family protein [Gemmatimonadaceae bacterium]
MRSLSWLSTGFGVLLVGGLIAAAPTRVRAQELGIDVGSAAPAAKVHTLDGKEADLGQYIGKSPVIMEFWATWCPNCKELEPTLLDAAKKYGTRVKFVGVAVSVNQSPERVKAFVEKHKLPGDQYFDTKGNATGAYDVPATSYVVVINKAGKVVYTGLGGKQDLDAAIRKAL